MGSRAQQYRPDSDVLLESDPLLNNPLSNVCQGNSLGGSGSV
jgi:hypothetical protein